MRVRADGSRADPADAARERIAARGDLHAFVSLSSERGPGEVVAVKDLLDVRGLVTTCGAADAGALPAVGDAAAVSNLRRAGATIVGKTNLYPWAYGVASVNPYHGDVPNPRDPTRSAGGSSSGSAAAVAAELCDWAVGTDTAGSIRIPAACCGVVGFKPTWGMVPTDGVQDLAPSHDTVGALAGSVRAAGRGTFAMAASQLPPAARAAVPLRLAVPAGWVAGLDEEVAAAWRPIGAALPAIDFLDRARLFELAELVQGYEAAQVHAVVLETDPARFSVPVRARLERGLDIDPGDARRAAAELRAMAEQADRALDGWDGLVLPTTACVAPALGDETVREPLTRFTRPFNATGQPVVALPLPVTGLPVGLQVVGRRGDDARLVAVAERIERELAASGRVERP